MEGEVKLIGENLTSQTEKLQKRLLSPELIEKMQNETLEAIIDEREKTLKNLRITRAQYHKQLKKSDTDEKTRQIKVWAANKQELLQAQFQSFRGKTLSTFNKLVDKNSNEKMTVKLKLQEM